MKNISQGKDDIRLDDSKNVRSAVEDQLARYLQTQIKAAGNIGTEYVMLLDEVEQLIRRGGKRLRPLLAVWSYAGFGGTDAPSIIRAASALELFHAGILMHDDIIDRDTVRWRGPNITGRYIDTFKTQPPAQARLLADTHALLAGDVCITLSYQQLLASGFDRSRSAEGLELMYQIFLATVGGELLDTVSPLTPLAKLTPESLLAVSRHKTAHYSFGLPLELGALLAGTATEQRTKLRLLGECLGIAYQLQDDLLGMLGDEATLGKPILSDLREGKRTLLVYFAYRHSSGAGKQVLRRWLGNKRAGTEELQLVRTVLYESGAVEKVQCVITGYHSRAQQLLPQIGWQKPYAEQLAALFTSLVDRQK